MNIHEMNNHDVHESSTMSVTVAGVAPAAVSSPVHTYCPESATVTCGMLSRPSTSVACLGKPFTHQQHQQYAVADGRLRA